MVLFAFANDRTGEGPTRERVEEEKLGFATKEDMPAVWRLGLSAGAILRDTCQFSPHSLWVAIVR